MLGPVLLLPAPVRAAIDNHEPERSAPVGAQFNADWVQVHTRLDPNVDPAERFLGWGAKMQALGVQTYVRQIKTAGEPCWWRSAVGASASEGIHRLFQKVLDDARAREQNLIGYYRHMEDLWVVSEHPEWLCRDENGQSVPSARGTNICLNSPYRDFLLTRFAEARNLGVSGIYLDANHMPPEGCWCRWCQERADGLPKPERRSEQDPARRQARALVADTVADFLTAAAEVVEGRAGQGVLVASVHRLPTLASCSLDARTLASSPSPKTEFLAPLRVDSRVRKTWWPAVQDAGVDADALQSLGWALSRDLGGGRPAHVWLPHWGEGRELLSAAVGILAHGCVANIDVDARRYGPATEKALGDTLPQLRRYAQPLQGARRLDEHALLVPDAVLAPHCDEATLTAAAAVAARYQALLRAGQPLRLYSESQLAAGMQPGLRLHTPAAALLQQASRDRLRRLQRQGLEISDPAHAIPDVDIAGIGVRLPTGWQAHWYAHGSAELLELRLLLTPAFLAAAIPGARRPPEWSAVGQARAWKAERGDAVEAKAAVVRIQGSASRLRETIVAAGAGAPAWRSNGGSREAQIPSFICGSKLGCHVLQRSLPWYLDTTERIRRTRRLLGNS